MSAQVLPLLALLFLILSFLSALFTHSLRMFSRSRLSAICKSHGRQNRFGDILKQHEHSLLVFETSCLLFAFCFAGSFWGWISPGVADQLASQSTADGNINYWVTSELAIESTLLLAGVALILVAIPWTIARVTGESVLYHSWPLISGVSRVLHPWAALVGRIDQMVHRMSGVSEPVNGDLSILTEEIRTVVTEGEREGLLESGASDMIHRVMELRKEDTAAIMTPRTEMDCIMIDSTIEQACQRLLEFGHSRVPVIGDTTDDIIGILYAKDILGEMRAKSSPTKQLKDILRDPYYVPETTGIDKLLETMKKEHVHLAIVIDEYSGVAGLVTLEDILEEIVGEIVDEYDDAESTGIVMLENGCVEVESRVHIDDLNEQFQFELPESDEYDTIGGFVFHELGRVPKTGEQFDWNHLQLTVTSADNRKIDKINIEKRSEKSMSQQAAF